MLTSPDEYAPFVVEEVTFVTVLSRALAAWVDRKMKIMARVELKTKCSKTCSVRRNNSPITFAFMGSAFLLSKCMLLFLCFFI
jgi:hypothetical protein